MPDRHWMEKWRWNHSVDPPVLIRKKDRKEATGWQHAAELEGLDKGVSATTMLTDQRYAMVPLSELYPDDITVPEPVRLGERREAKEAVPYVERMGDLEPPPPPIKFDTDSDEPLWAYGTTPKARRSRTMFGIGWGLAVGGVLIFLITGELLIGIVLVLGFFAGAAMASYIVKD